MIITSSRASSTKCWRRALNTWHRDLEAPRSMNLVDGSGVHDAIAHGLATRDWVAALEVAKEKFDESVKNSTIPEEQTYLIGDHWDMVVALVQCFAENVQHEPYQVVQPECAIDVPLPRSEHNCIWLHHEERVSGDWVEKWGRPDPTAILERRIRSPHNISVQDGWGTPQGGKQVPDHLCKCWQPHRIVGQTDAIVTWERNLWLLEHKTTSVTGEMFWAQWELDLQPSIYLYGIWKTLGIQPRGIILNALSKPSERQVAAWNSKRKSGAPKSASDYIKYERQCFLRSTEDLLRIEKEMTALCNEWEWRILQGDFRPALMKGVCTEYGRRCDFHTPCTNHEEEGSFAGMAKRAGRYDDVKIAETLTQITGGGPPTRTTDITPTS